MKQTGKPQAFFWELTVVILFFALAAAVTLRLFAAGSRQSQKNASQNGAMLAAASAAEQIAAADNADISFPGSRLTENGSFEVLYGEDWQPDQEAPHFRMVVSAESETYPAGVLCRYAIRLEEVSGGELYVLHTAKYFPEGEKRP